MKNATGEGHITTVIIIIIGIVAAVGAVLIPRIMKNLSYISCCTNAGGKWVNGSNGHCEASTPTTCVARDNVWREYESCLIDHDKHDANTKYKTVSCSN